VAPDNYSYGAQVHESAFDNDCHELEVDPCTINDRNDRSFDVHVNEPAVDNDCHELEVDLCALNDRSYKGQVNVFALDEDCLNLKWICVPLMIAATELRRMCLPSMMMA